MKPAQTVILCEDRQQECFIRRFLKQRGWSSHDFRSVIAPKAGGSGEQFVRTRFPAELAAVRSRSSKSDTNLIVIIDADRMTVPERIEALRKECQKAQTPPPTEGEKVAFIVPKRNIETWLAYLRDEKVNEDEVYPKYAEESMCQVETRNLNEMCLRKQLVTGAPPSLVAACDESKKILRSAG